MIIRRSPSRHPIARPIQSARPGETDRHIFEHILTYDEVVLLARYLFDRASQMELMAELGVKQTTLSHRIRAAAGKLAGAGLPVKLPGRGRCKCMSHVVAPDAMDRLLTSADESGVTYGRWVDSKNISSEASVA